MAENSTEPQPASPRAPRPSQWPWLAGLAIALLLGAILRLVWVRDIEYKFDEAWTFQRVQAWDHLPSIPWTGMKTSTGLPNFGMSLWIFVPLGKLLTLHEPPDLARGIQVLNVIALFALAGFAWVCVRPAEREPWLWAVALAAVNPLMVVLHRKIWPPSMLPLFSILMLCGWWYRERRLAAFGWGLLAVLIGQVHMAGFFLAAGFAGWALLFDRRRVAWLGWICGSALGSLPMLPWLYHMASAPRSQAISQIRWHHLFQCTFWIRWITEPMGISVAYSLDRDFRDFLRYPLVHGQSTYLMAILHAVIGLTLIAVLAMALWRCLKQRREFTPQGVGPESATAFTVNGALWGFGLLLTLSLVPIHRHYLMVAFPLGFVWLARLVLGPGSDCAMPSRRGRRLLLAVCVVQLIISATFLAYIHNSQRRIDGDYCFPYRALGEQEFRLIDETVGIGKAN
ncbi:MAG: hypothetical protein K2R98_31540 [Gemmataceae bacterium]|nr:hypothetical protein [Gemmataceae bacterium]